jgi:hypothetical protein
MLKSNSGITRDYILELITEEKESYSAYSQACARYNVKPEQVVILCHQAKMEILEKLLKKA